MTRVRSHTNHKRGKVQHFHVETHADWVRSQFIRYFFSVLLNRSRTGGDVSVFGLQSPVILHFCFCCIVLHIYSFRLLHSSTVFIVIIVT